MTRFLSENDELGEALMDLVRSYRTAAYRDRLREFRDRVVNAHGIVFSGMGTSEFTPLLIASGLSHLGIPNRTIDTGEMLHYGGRGGQANQLHVLTSQSGETVELIRLLTDTSFGQPYVAITNAETSTLASRSVLTLPLCAGTEVSITTKTFTNNLALLHILATVIRDIDALDAAFADIEQAARAISVVDKDAVARAADLLAPADSLAFVARGPAIVNARQCALTFMEGAHCMAAAFTGGAFNHGPMEAADSDFRLVLFAPSGQTEALADGLLRRVLPLGARVALMSDRSSAVDGITGNVGLMTIAPTDGRHSEHLFPIVAARTHNHLLHELAERRGVRAGEFRYGGKVTIEE